MYAHTHINDFVTSSSQMHPVRLSKLYWLTLRLAFASIVAWWSVCAYINFGNSIGENWDPLLHPLRDFLASVQYPNSGLSVYRTCFTVKWKKASSYNYNKSRLENSTLEQEQALKFDGGSLAMIAQLLIDHRMLLTWDKQSLKQSSLKQSRLIAFLTTYVIIQYRTFISIPQFHIVHRPVYINRNMHGN